MLLKSIKKKKKKKEESTSARLASYLIYIYIVLLDLILDDVIYYLLMCLDRLFLTSNTIREKMEFNDLAYLEKCLISVFEVFYTFFRILLQPNHLDRQTKTKN